MTLEGQEGQEEVLLLGPHGHGHTVAMPSCPKTNATPLQAGPQTRFVLPLVVLGPCSPPIRVRPPAPPPCVQWPRDSAFHVEFSTEGSEVHP